ncbi:Twitching mobility protein [Methylacidimicrobium cyclopophantes]|uniref:Twitching mobility protein n=1 Tax=Methylacidimicrobium cyclopophantes TaxID=1041766 RepID=A0A5E6M7T3_9BACT|nr:hypothetical protein [Methylacidimicrobium cyclopophantes]VVM05423.1 Twitching mobility protein [Methylacidimicrobium cyclopophantes]
MPPGSTTDSSGSAGLVCRSLGNLCGKGLRAPVNHLDEILISALEARATAVHLFAGEAPAARVEGKLLPLSFPPVSRPQLDLWLQALAGPRQSSEAKRAATGRILYRGPDGILFRGHFFESKEGSGAVLLPILPPPPIDQRLLPPALRHLADIRGLVLVAGGIATGKTSLLGSLVAWLGSVQFWRILVLEVEPARFSFPFGPSWICRWEIPRDFPTLTAALDAAVALDGEMVAIDPLRRAEEIAAALALAASGKLVLATHESEGATAAVANVIHELERNGKGLEIDRLAATLRLTLCPIVLPRKDGDGFFVLLEVLPGLPAVAAAIRARSFGSLEEYLQVAPDGGKRVDDAILQLWKAGMIRSEVAFRHAREKERLLAHFEEVPRQGSSPNG